MSYVESKKKIDAIRQEYGCKGEVIFKTSLQYIVEYGQYKFRNETWFNSCIESANKKHDHAEQTGKHLWIGRDFEIALLKCARELAEIDAYDLLRYVQKEIWLGGEIGEPDYQRAIEIIRICLCDAEYGYGRYGSDKVRTLEKFKEFELTDAEIEYFGWGYLFETEDDEEEK